MEAATSRTCGHPIYMRLIPHLEVGVKDRMLTRCGIVALCLLGLPALACSSVHGIRNFHQVDSHVYRGGQPTAEGFRYLAKTGVRTVLDLRQRGERSSAEARFVTSLGMQYVSVPMSGLTPPTKDEIARILALLEDGTTGPVFVHCRRGADRTGAVVAAYRIDHDHWNNFRALEEALWNGMSPVQLPRMRFIRNFQPLTAKRDSNPSAVLQNNRNFNPSALPISG
jgi:tyrosine-protein phosphatase SIW14